LVRSPYSVADEPQIGLPFFADFATSIHLFQRKPYQTKQAGLIFTLPGEVTIRS
jgi:hypothetical protein